MFKKKRPWWRHWHVEGHNFGYTLAEAKMVVEADFKSAPEWDRPGMSRCDIDHIAPPEYSDSMDERTTYDLTH